MIKLFRSSSEIIRESESLFHILTADYWAHIDGRKPTEGLFEHSRLVADYLQQIINAHGIEPVINKLVEGLCNAITLKWTEKPTHLVKELFINSIFLHDLGKINPNFQVEKMKNPGFKSKNLKIKHHHSFPGAYIFCNYYFSEILKHPHLDDNDKNIFYFLTFCFSNPIIRHHSSYIDFTKEFHSKEHELSECFELLEKYKLSMGDKLFSSSFFINFKTLEDQFSSTASPNAYLFIYILIKLSYSLLTASDFYATNEFMADIKVSEFGLIEDDLRERIKNRFWSLKKYNNDLSKNFDSYLSTSFDKLSEINNENLNILRQKLTAEIVSTFRKKKDNPWYYIEAPTGAGKTNLSLACIAELLAADNSLNKAFYVFPFTTLITQTFEAIKETIELSNSDIIQLHSKVGLHRKNENNEQDTKYGNERTLYLDHLFVNYPFVVTSHIKFFEIVKGNDKESNYLFHRLCNSIVVLDEVQSYNPKHWDKMIYFIEHYAELLNMKFIIMSATLPKIDELSRTAKGKFISLTPNKDQFFKNPNFISRVQFDFSLIDDLKPFKNDKYHYFEKLSYKIYEEAETYAFANNNKVHVLVEFITKNSASKFLNYMMDQEIFNAYQIYIISGDILESRRKQIIQEVKEQEHSKLIVVSTQVVEAGVDIDMDIGFKNRAILDSDEQLAGRINRNASKNGCKVFLFELDNIKTIYGNDERYKQQQSDEYLESNWKNILLEKKFHELYQKVFAERLKLDWTDKGRFPSYMENFKRLDFSAIHNEFTLIEDNQTEAVFIPINIDVPEELKETYLSDDFDVLAKDGALSGEKVFDLYIKILTRKTDFLTKKIDLKKIAGMISLFTINAYPKVTRELGHCFDIEKEKFGFKYLLHHDAYSYENGFDLSKTKEDIFL